MKNARRPSPISMTLPLVGIAAAALMFACGDKGAEPPQVPSPPETAPAETPPTDMPAGGDADGGAPAAPNK